VFDRWRFSAALAVAVGIGFPALAAAAAEAPAGAQRDQPRHHSQRAAHGHRYRRSRAGERSNPLARPTQRFASTIDVQVHKIRVQQRHRDHDRWRPLPGDISLSTLNAIGDCESGGDPHAVSAGGTYRGKYQFDYGTWASVGGHGDPAQATEKEQDYRAALLYERSGSSPWPVCG
jgi:hypothetical protein